MLKIIHDVLSPDNYLLTRQYLSLWPLFPLLIGLMVLGFLGMRWVQQLEKDGLAAEKGADGEARVVDAFRASLPAAWHLFRDVEWPDRQWGDTDLILVGPGGVWAFEVKAYTGQVRNRGDRWEYRGRWGWRKLSKDPGRQVRRNAVNTKDYLERHGAAPGYVQAVVLWAGDAETLEVADPATPVWRLGRVGSAAGGALAEGQT